MLTNEQIVKADQWRILHAEHVTELLKENDPSYPPNKEDASHPELWKAGHWKWFLINA